MAANLKISVPNDGIWERWAEKRQPFIGDPERPQAARDGVLLGSRYAPRLWLPSGHIIRVPAEAVSVRHRHARLFDNVALDRLDNTASSPVTAVPFTMAGWQRPDDAAAQSVLMCIQDKDANDNFWELVTDGSAVGDPVRLRIRTTTNLNINTSTGYTAGTWHHLCAVDTSATDHSVFIDGGSEGNSTTSKIPTGVDSLSIGARGSLTPANYCSGDIAECAIWDVALSDADVAIAAKPVSPLLVRPQSLVFYCPIIGRFSPEIDIVGGLNMTVTGTVASAHPRILRPGRSSFPGFTPAAAGGDPEGSLLGGKLLRGGLLRHGVLVRS